MAWAVKYQCEFVDVEGLTWIIYFDEDAWGGSITTLTTGPTPIVISWNQSDKYQTIVGSSADIQLKYQSDIETLCTEDSGSIRVSAYRDGTLFWQGFLAPGQFYRRFNEPVHFITLSASDGLGELKGVKFEDGTGDPYYYLETEIVTIANILLKTGIVTTIYDAINIYEDDHDATTADSPLAQTYIFQEMYWDEYSDARGNCYEVLEDILKKYGAQVRYSYGHWYLTRPNDYSLHADIYYRVFTSAGVYSSNSSYTASNDIDSDMFYVKANQEITRLMGVGSSEVTFQPGMKQNALPNGSFDGFAWNGGSVLNQPRYWTNSGATFLDTTVDNTITLYSNSSSSQPTGYIYTPNIQLYSAKSIRVTLNYRCYYQLSPTYARVCVGLIYGTGDYYEPSTDTWSNTSYAGGTSPVVIDMIAESKASMLTYETIVIEPSVGPQTINGEGQYGFGNYMRLWLYEFWCENGGVANWVSYSHITVEIERDAAFPETYVYTFDGTNSINNIYRESLRLGDSFMSSLSRGSDRDFMYYGITQDAQDIGNETDAWFIKGHNTTATTPVNISQLLARQYVEGMYKSLDVISGSIRSAHETVPHTAFEDSDFTDSIGFNKRFFPKGISYDVRLNEYNGDWVECPVIYTDTGYEWDSCDASVGSGDLYTITGNELEIDNWTSTSSGDFAYFDSYTAVAGETIRIVLELTDDGSSTLPSLYIAGAYQATAWGTNYFTYYAATAGAKTIELGYASSPRTFNFTAVLTLYSITGV